MRPYADEVDDAEDEEPEPEREAGVGFARVEEVQLQEEPREVGKQRRRKEERDRVQLEEDVVELCIERSKQVCVSTRYEELRGATRRTERMMCCRCAWYRTGMSSIARGAQRLALRRRESVRRGRRASRSASVVRDGGHWQCGELSRRCSLPTLPRLCPGSCPWLCSGSLK